VEEETLVHPVISGLKLEKAEEMKVKQTLLKSENIMFSRIREQKTKLVAKQLVFTQVHCTFFLAIPIRDIK
jgi:hypothetical protein